MKMQIDDESYKSSKEISIGGVDKGMADFTDKNQ